MSLTINHNLSYAQLYQSIDIPVPEPKVVVLCLSRLLDQMVLVNQTKSPIKTIFHSKNIPGISIQKYLERFAAYSRCSVETFFLALIYLDRYFEKIPEQCLVARNVHKLFFISLVIAAKFNDDLKLGNKDFARIGGVDKCDLCLLEIAFLRSIVFHTNVSSPEYISYVKSVFEYMD